MDAVHGHFQIPERIFRLIIYLRFLPHSRTHRYALIAKKSLQVVREEGSVSYS